MSSDPPTPLVPPPLDPPLETEAPPEPETLAAPEAEPEPVTATPEPVSDIELNPTQERFWRKINQWRTLDDPVFDPTENDDVMERVSYRYFFLDPQSRQELVSQYGSLKISLFFLKNYVKDMVELPLHLMANFIKFMHGDIPPQTFLNGVLQKEMEPIEKSFTVDDLLNIRQQQKNEQLQGMIDLHATQNVFMESDNEHDESKKRQRTEQLDETEIGQINEILRTFPEPFRLRPIQPRLTVEQQELTLERDMLNLLADFNHMLGTRVDLSGQSFSDLQTNFYKFLTQVQTTPPDVIMRRIDYLISEMERARDSVLSNPLYSESDPIDPDRLLNLQQLRGNLHSLFIAIRNSKPGSIVPLQLLSSIYNTYKTWIQFTQELTYKMKHPTKHMEEQLQRIADIKEGRQGRVRMDKTHRNTALEGEGERTKRVRQRPRGAAAEIQPGYEDLLNRASQTVQQLRITYVPPSTTTTTTTTTTSTTTSIDQSKVQRSIRLHAANRRRRQKLITTLRETDLQQAEKASQDLLESKQPEKRKPPVERHPRAFTNPLDLPALPSSDTEEQKEEERPAESHTSAEPQTQTPRHYPLVLYQWPPAEPEPEPEPEPGPEPETPGNYPLVPYEPPGPPGPPPPGPPPPGPPGPPGPPEPPEVREPPPPRAPDDFEAFAAYLIFQRLLPKLSEAIVDLYTERKNQPKGNSPATRYSKKFVKELFIGKGIMESGHAIIPDTLYITDRVNFETWDKQTSIPSPQLTSDEKQYITAQKPQLKKDLEELQRGVVTSEIRKYFNQNHDERAGTKGMKFGTTNPSFGAGVFDSKQKDFSSEHNQTTQRENAKVLQEDYDYNNDPLKRNEVNMQILEEAQKTVDNPLSNFNDRVYAKIAIPVIKADLENFNAHHVNAMDRYFGMWQRKAISSEDLSKYSLDLASASLGLTSGKLSKFIEDNLPKPEKILMFLKDAPFVVKQAVWAFVAFASKYSNIGFILSSLNRANRAVSKTYVALLTQAIIAAPSVKRKIKKVTKKRKIKSKLS